MKKRNKKSRKYTPEKIVFATTIIILLKEIVSLLKEIIS